MKNENDKVRAFAMEVIEKLTEKGMSCQETLYNGLCESVKIVQSLLPKEEDTKTESDEVKVGDEVEYHVSTNPVGWRKDAFFTGGILRDGRFLVESKDGVYFGTTAIRKLQPTLEQRARKKAEEIYKEWSHGKRPGIEHITEALLIDPKTL